MIPSFIFRKVEVWHLYYPEGTEDSYEEALAPEGL
jgi:hypothetical protein